MLKVGTLEKQVARLQQRFEIRFGEDAGMVDGLFDNELKKG
jgi:hypothetical protein